MRQSTFCFWSHPNQATYGQFCLARERLYRARAQFLLDEIHQTLKEMEDHGGVGEHLPYLDDLAKEIGVLSLDWFEFSSLVSVAPLHPNTIKVSHLRNCVDRIIEQIHGRQHTLPA